MTTRYRVEYELKSHRRDLFIEWIKSLLAVPFVLHSHHFEATGMEQDSGSATSLEARTRYAQCMHDVEELIRDHISRLNSEESQSSKLRLLVPSIGSFFTPLPLKEAFLLQDERRHISSRRFVAPVEDMIKTGLKYSHSMMCV